VKEISISRTFFQTSRIDDSFLDMPVNTWEKNQSFKAATDKIKNLACINDCADRGVALIQEFIATATNDEAQKQYLLQVVENY